ncbi:GNAT family N-acetyltransferase [Myxococcaceae bacterium GXIMD 01537]
MIRPEELQAEAQARASWTELDVVRDVEGFAALQEEWDALLEASGASVFSSWQWLYPWWELAGAGRRPFLVRVRERTNGLIGLLPLYLEERRGFGVRYRRLGLLGDEHVGSDHLGPLVRRGVEREVLAALAHGLLRHRSEWDVLELLDVDSEEPILHGLLGHLEVAGLGVEFDARCDCPYESFEPGLTFEALLERTPRAENYLRRRRWLARQPGFRIERTERGEGLQDALSAFFRLHALRWGSASRLNTPEVERFHRRAVAALAERGRVCLYTLWVGGSAVASVYALRHGGTFSYYNAGYEPSWSPRSVGLVLVGETFQDALAGGFREYDFLRGTEPYKAEWTAQVRKTVAARVWHGLPGTLICHAGRLERRARERLKALLPARALDELRRLSARGGSPSGASTPSARRRPRR